MHLGCTQLPFTKRVSNSAHSGLPPEKWSLLHSTSAEDCSNPLPNSASKQEFPSVLLSSLSQLLGFLTPYKSVCPQYVLPWSLLATIGSGPRSARMDATTLHAGTQRTSQLFFPTYRTRAFPYGPVRPQVHYLPSIHLFFQHVVLVHEHNIKFL